MGLYDTYGETQLKVREADDMRDYKTGDKAEIPDGVYVAHEGVIVIVNGVFVAEFPYLTDKYGGMISTEELLGDRNPVAQAIKEFGPPKGVG